MTLEELEREAQEAADNVWRDPQTVSHGDQGSVSGYNRAPLLDTVAPLPTQENRRVPISPVTPRLENTGVHPQNPSIAQQETSDLDTLATRFSKYRT
jgi:hypothetical protein